jgi:hypothetical protein
MNPGRLLGRHRPASTLRRDGGYVPGDSCPAIPNDVRVRTRTNQRGRRWHLRQQYVCREREVNHKSVVVHDEVEDRAEGSLRRNSRGWQNTRMTTPPSRTRQRRTWFGEICPFRLSPKTNAPGKSVCTGHSVMGHRDRRKKVRKQAMKGCVRDALTVLGIRIERRKERIREVGKLREMRMTECGRMCSVVKGWG